MGKWIRVLYRDKCKILSRLICHSQFRYPLINNNYNKIPSLQLNNNNFIHNMEPNHKYHKISLQIKFNKDQYNTKSRYNSQVLKKLYLNNKLLSNNSLPNSQVFNNKQHNIYAVGKPQIVILLFISLAFEGPSWRSAANSFLVFSFLPGFPGSFLPAFGGFRFSVKRCLFLSLRRPLTHHHQQT